MASAPFGQILGGQQRQVGGVPSLEDVRRVLSRSDKTRETPTDAQGILVTACGRTITVPEGNGGVTLLLHVQKALQDELGLPDQAFDINDRNGTRLRTDHDLREAVAQGRLPLNAKLSDTSAKIQSIQSDIKWVCQQVGSLRGELESQKQEHTTEVDALRQDLYASLNSVLEATKLGRVGPDAFSGGTKLDLINADQGIPLASMEHFANLENDIRHLETKLDEMTMHFRNTMSEYSRHHDRSSTQNSDGIARLVDRCAGLDARIANAEIGMASIGMRPKPRDGPLHTSPGLSGSVDGSQSGSRWGINNRQSLSGQSPEPGMDNRGAPVAPPGGGRQYERSPGHSPEPSVNSMPMGNDLDRNGFPRMSVASHTNPAQSPSRLGIGGGFPGPGRPGGPSSAYGPAGAGSRAASAGGAGALLPGSAYSRLQELAKSTEAGSGMYGLGGASMGGSGQYSAGGGGPQPRTAQSMPGGPGIRANRSQSPRFPIDKSTAPNARTSMPAGAAVMPRGTGARPGSAATSESSAAGNILRSRSGQQGGEAPSPKAAGVRPSNNPGSPQHNQGAGGSLSQLPGAPGTQLGKVVMPNA